MIHFFGVKAEFSAAVTDPSEILIYLIIINFENGYAVQFCRNYDEFFFQASLINKKFKRFLYCSRKKAFQTNAVIIVI